MTVTAKHLLVVDDDPRLRELAILQASYSAGSDYAWSHHIEVGFDCGVTEDDLRAIADESAGRQSKLDPLSRAVLSAARELTLKVELSDATFAVLRQSLDNEQMVDLFYAISNYNSVARMIAGFKLAVEPAYLDYLKRFPIKRA